MRVPSLWVTVPAGTVAGKCRAESCGKRIYWVRIRGKPHPVDCEVDGGRRPSGREKDPAQVDLFTAPLASQELGGLAVFDGRGVSHFQTCPVADRFRRGIGD